MTTTHEIASDLRKLADALEQATDKTVISPKLSFGAGSNREQFLGAVAVMPHPFDKVIPSTSNEYDIVRLEHKMSSLIVETWAFRTAACRIVEPARPAVYDCEPLLSAIEEEALSAASGEAKE